MHSALRLHLLAPLLTVVSLPLASAQELSEAQSAAIAELCEPWSHEDAPGVSVVVTRGEDIVYAAGAGRAHLEYDVAIEPDTVFHIASLSKQITAFALVLLERDGKLSLDDDVREHVPWLHDFGHVITLRHLLQHTSGLRDQWDLLTLSGHRLEDLLTRSHILRILRGQRELNFPPGERYMYSNSGFTLAALVVEIVSGQSFASFCEERIFEPLGMTHSHIHGDAGRIVPNRAYSYAPRGTGWAKRILSYSNAGATGVFTTGPDFGRWMQNLGSGEVGGVDAVLALREPGRLNDGTATTYGLGIGVGARVGHAFLGHGGADAGFRCSMGYFPDLDLGIAVFSNAASCRASELRNRIADLLIEPIEVADEGQGADAAHAPSPEPAADAGSGPAKVETEPIPLAAMVGRYFCPELEVHYEIVAKGERVALRQRRHGECALTRSGPTTLQARAWGLEKLEFVREEGAVVGLRLTTERVVNLWLQRTE